MCVCEGERGIRGARDEPEVQPGGDMISLKTMLRPTPLQNKQRKTENRRGTHRSVQMWEYSYPDILLLFLFPNCSASGVDGMWGHDKYEELLEMEA